MMSVFRWVHWGRRLTPVALYFSIALAIFANGRITPDGAPTESLVFFAVAIGLFLGGSIGVSLSGRSRSTRESVAATSGALPPETNGARMTWPRRASLGSLVILALASIAWVNFAGNRFTAANVIPWVAAIVLFFAVFWEAPALGWTAWLRGVRSQLVDRPVLTLSGAAVLAVLFLGVFFRYHNLAETPLEMTSDHAEKLLDVWDVVHDIHPVFFERNTGREPLQFYFTAATVTVLGISIDHFALKLGTAFFGVTSVIWAVLLGRQLFGLPVGLVTGALVAVSHWATAIDRVGLRFPFTAAFATPTLFFLMRAFQHNRRNDWLLCGLFLGIGLHTYISMRIVPLLLAVLIAVKVVWDMLDRRRGMGAPDAPHVGGLLPRGARELSSPASQPLVAEVTALQRGFWANGLLAFAAMVLVFLPLGRYMVDEPQNFWCRVLTRAAEVERPVQGDAPAIFIDNLKNAALMFNVRGDTVQANTLPGSPVLDEVTGALLVLGAALAVWTLVRTADRRFAYVLLALFIMLLPSTLSLSFPGENPSVARMGGAIPVVMLIAALPLVIAARRTAELPGFRWGPGYPPGRFIPVGVTIAILGIAGVLNYQWYFERYDANWRRAAWNTTELGAVIRDWVGAGGGYHYAFHVPYPHWADTRNIGINAGDPKWANAVDLAAPAGQRELLAHAADPARKLYLVHRDDARSVELLQATYPKAEVIRPTTAQPNHAFVVVQVAGESVVGREPPSWWLTRSTYGGVGC